MKYYEKKIKNSIAPNTPKKSKKKEALGVQKTKKILKMQICTLQNIGQKAHINLLYREEKRLQCKKKKKKSNVQQNYFRFNPSSASCVGY